ncbi:MAG: bacteriohemerythrin [Spirochaetota bacterium]
MALIDWSDGLSVGVTEFDNHHKKLIEIVNRLHDAMRSGKASDVIAGVLTELINYTKTHFAAEEARMEEHGFGGRAAHIEEHRALVAKVLDFESKFRAKTILLSVDILNFLRDWLATHIMKTDKQYGPFFNGKGIR